MKTRLTLFAFLFLLTHITSAQVAEEVNKRYQTKEGRTEIAKTLGAADRDQRQQPESLIEKLNIQAGMSIADVGTGVGYMLPYLSRAVGPRGKVFAEDIQQDFLNQAKERIDQDKLANVDLVLGTDTDPKLATASLDDALILDVYHHFDYPDKMLAHVRSAIRPGGRLFLVDYYKHSRPDHVRLERDDVVKEVEANGFKLLNQMDQIPDEQYVLIFLRP